MKKFLTLTILTFCFQYCFAFCFSLGDFSIGEDCNKKKSELKPSELISSQLEHKIHPLQKFVALSTEHSIVIKNKKGEFAKKIKGITISEASFSGVCHYNMKVGFDFANSNHHYRLSNQSSGRLFTVDYRLF